MEEVTLHRLGRPRGARSNVTRERIVVAASGVFGEFGYHATTFQAVAARAHLTRPAINHYFANKQLLYQAVLNRNESILDNAVERARTENSLIARLSSVIYAFAQLGEEDRTAAAFAVTAVLDAQRDPELRLLVGDLQGPTRRFLTESLTEAIDRGELATSATVADLTETLLAVLWGIGFYIAALGDRDESAAVIASVQALLANRLWRIQLPISPAAAGSSE
ncbi:TetR family transcriptional regulator [Mycolicibacter terrae]|jgi:AcrR family transcriptional regulator|uniref:TetR family transcriptional regulator n=1 Tax=Mycolicibacter terrae TaxID=1788 RepID=A0AAD1I1L6_9MYCO|nr:TetR/AcrR family transcriptional regulator [Mycolicibacter terrae]ORW97819.1 TetR family transcriptional regulator [Mycolicibacter terrae]BBX24546.1 TetR family transcriptional regulator [Mycolicibacter terrae]SNV53187.1 TetR family transcriptional regulator [Mycolicibacter terrae]